MLNSFFSKFRSPVTLTLVALSLVILVSDYHFRWKNKQWEYAINSDAYDLYRYLPIVFITHDFVHLNTGTKEPEPIKHYIGTAIFFLPFFGLAYLLSFFLHFPLDGYSILFQVFVCIGTLFYLILGLWYFAKFLRFYNLPEWLIAITVSLIVFATNVYYFTVVSPGWSHPIALLIITFMLYHVKKIYAAFNKESLFYILISFSFLFWTRPTDCVVFVLIPFLAQSKTQFIETIKKARREIGTLIFTSLVSVIPLICQLILYKLQTGHFVVWSYGRQEIFNFLKPEILNVLFSYAKGLFVYSPITFISLFGLVSLYRRSPFQFYGILIYMLLNLYIISSWWCWNYGWCYGPRAFIEHYPLFFLLLALFIYDLKNSFVKTTLGLLLCFFCVITGIQTYQSEQRILDIDFKTDRKGFWNVFLKTDRGYSGKYYRFPVDSSKANIASQTIYFNDMEKPDTSWSFCTDYHTGFAHSGNSCSLVNKKMQYSCALVKKMSAVPYNRNVLIRASGWFYISAKGSRSYFAINFSNETKSFNFNPFSMDGYITEYGTWEYLVFEMYMPKIRIDGGKEKNDTVGFYLFNESDINCYVDDLKIEFIEFKKLERELDIWWD